MAKVEKIYAAYIEGRDKPVGRDDQKVADLKKQWQDAIKDAQQYVVEGAFDDDTGAQRSGRSKCFYRRRRNELFLFFPGKSAGIMGLSRVGASFCIPSCGSSIRNAMW